MEPRTATGISKGRLVRLVALLVLITIMLAAVFGAVLRPDLTQDAIVPASSTTASPRPESTPTDLTPTARAFGCPSTDADIKFELLPEATPISTAGVRLDVGQVAFVSLERPRSALIWRLDDGGALTVLARITTIDPMSWVTLVDWSPGDRGLVVTVGRTNDPIAVSCYDLFLLAWDGTSVDRLTDSGGASPFGLLVSPDGVHLAVPTKEGFDIANPHRILESYDGPCSDSWGSAMAWAPDGGRIARVCDRALSILDLRSGEERVYGPVAPLRYEVSGMRWSNDGRQIVVIGGDLVQPDGDLGMAVWHVDVASGSVHEERYLEDHSVLGQIPFQPVFLDAQVIAVVADDGRPWLLDLDTGEARRTGGADQDHATLYGSANGRAVLRRTDDISLLDSSGGERPIGTLPHWGVFEFGFVYRMP